MSILIPLMSTCVSVFKALGVEHYLKTKYSVSKNSEVAPVQK
jgi:hypothetical protein